MRPIHQILRFLFLFFVFVSLTNLSLAESPDYGNDSNTAFPVEPNGALVDGVLNGATDQDWFQFPAQSYGLYELTFHSSLGTKNIAVYSLNDSGQLQQTLNTYTNETLAGDIFITNAGSGWLKVYGGNGSYYVTVNFISTYPSDTYPNWCTGPAALTVDTSPLFDSITQNGIDEDWFTFNCSAFHQYQINLSRALNTDVRFDLFRSPCGSSISSNKTGMTFVPWDNNNFDVRVHDLGFNANGFYDVSVTDLGPQTDDYGNTQDLASPINPDGSFNAGSLNYSADYGSDEDWFMFEAVGDGLYEITLQSTSGLKNIVVYDLNDSGVFQQVTSFSTNSSLTNDVFIPRSGACWLKVYNGAGPFYVSVNFVGSFPTDTYPNWCTGPAVFEVNAPALYDGITLAGMDEDWFTFSCQTLHKYQITIVRPVNTDIRFDLYRTGCGTSISANKNGMTFVPWDSNFYDIRVHDFGFDANGFYELYVTDLNQQIDDYGNSPALAASITPNGLYMAGALQYSADWGGDEDWFQFMADTNGLYRVTLDNNESNYKYITVYDLNDSGVMRQLANFSVYHSTANQNVSITYSGYCWLKVYAASVEGNYQVAILSPVPTCGDINHPFPVGDLNKDCMVDLIDFALIAGNWLIDNRP